MSEKNCQYAKAVFIVLFAGLCSTAAMASDNITPNMRTEIRQSVSVVLATVKDSGTAGVSGQVNQCYESDPKSFDCLYLDVAGRRYDQLVTQAMGWPATPFFSTKRFLNRVGGVLISSGMSMDEANSFLQKITPLVDRQLELQSGD